MSRNKKILATIISLSVILLIIIYIINSSSVNAVSYQNEQFGNSIRVTPSTLQEFTENILSTNDIEQKNSDNYNEEININDMLAQYISYDISSIISTIKEDEKNEILDITDEKLSYEEFEEYLNSKNYYIFDYSTEYQKTTDEYVSVYISTIISYDAYNDNWIVTSGGYYPSGGFTTGGMSSYTFNSAKEVGDFDSVGIIFTNTSDYIPVLKSGYSYVHDDNGRAEYNQNSANGNESQGIIFEYQDSRYNGISFGYGFAANMIFGDDFADFQADIKAYHLHTWEENS